MPNIKIKLPSLPNLKLDVDSVKYLVVLLLVFVFGFFSYSLSGYISAIRDYKDSTISSTSQNSVLGTKAKSDWNDECISEAEFFNTYSKTELYYNKVHITLHTEKLSGCFNVDANCRSLIVDSTCISNYFKQNPLPVTEYRLNKVKGTELKYTSLDWSVDYPKLVTDLSISYQKRFAKGSNTSSVVQVPVISNGSSMVDYSNEKFIEVDTSRGILIYSSKGNSSIYEVKYNKDQIMYGEFKIIDKAERAYSDALGLNLSYWMPFTSQNGKNIGIYTANLPSNYRPSTGSLILSNKDAKELFNAVNRGTTVIIHD